jgi:thiol-disulfide isomerase/thioredoxin
MSNFVNNTTDKDIVIGKIYAEWCGHCQMLKPEWEKMKNNLKKSNLKYKFYEIEQTDEDNGIQSINETYLKNADKKLELQGGYPTIFKIVDGKIEYYNGERDSASMEQWITKQRNGGGNKLKRKTIKKKNAKRKTQKGKSIYKKFINLFGWFK